MDQETILGASSITMEMSSPSMELSDDQEKVLIFLQIFSAFLSLIGSSTIVFKIVRGVTRKQPTTPYDRIILGLSSCDIIASLVYAVGPFLLPGETSLRVWAFGSERSCEVLGFLNQLACVAAFWYNGMLSFYYLLTVRFRVRRKDFQNKYETPMHLSALFFPVTGFLGYLFGWYAEQDLSMTCWAAEPIVGYIFGGVPMVAVFLAILVNNIVIYAFVRRSLLVDDSQLPTKQPSVQFSDPELQPPQDFPGLTSTQKRLRREAATQGFLYVASFFITSTPLFVIQIMGGASGYTKEDQGKIYWLLALNCVVLPLQGLFNVFIYVRPTYTRFHNKYPTEAKLQVLKHALFDPKIPKLISPSAASASADVSSNNFRMQQQQHNQQRNPQCHPQLHQPTPKTSIGPASAFLSGLDPISESFRREALALEAENMPCSSDIESSCISESFRKAGSFSESFRKEVAAAVAAQDAPAPVIEEDPNPVSIDEIEESFRNNATSA
jgi:hypothetical protein